MAPADRFDLVVVGGGFFGTVLAARAAADGLKTLLAERDDALLTRASRNNQARVHNGYHYPRSLLTALRSRVNFRRFVDDYRECIDDTFEKLYAVPYDFTKVSAAQFEQFIRRIGAPIGPAPKASAALFDRSRVERVFAAEEYAFDAWKLQARAARDLAAAGVDVRLSTEALAPAADPAGGIRVVLRTGGAETAVRAKRVFVCTYSRINHFLRSGGLPTIPFKHEITELALVAPPPPLAKRGVTVMCGPFFSCMPFPGRGLHSLSHVRYTPRISWLDGPSHAAGDAYAALEAFPKVSLYAAMMRDAARFMPCIADTVQKDSFFEVKTVLPQNEGDDGRPILYRDIDALPGLTCVMGSKIDNIYDMLDEFGEKAKAA